MDYLTDELRTLLKTPAKIVVTTHREPDADALGSSLGWTYFLRKLGHTVTVVSPTEVPKNVRWLDHNSEVLNFEDRKGGRAAAISALNSVDLICCLDFSAIGRLKDFAPFVTRADKPVLIIDHHLHPEPFATFLVSDTRAAATAQIVYKMIRQWDETLFDPDIAECLYAGIMTDTGSFRFNNTDSEVHQIAGSLLEFGVKADKIYQLIYENNPVTRLHMLGEALSRIVVLPEYRTSYMVLTQDVLQKYHSGVGDTDGIVNFGLQVEGVVMTVLFVERNNEIKISFRSVGDFSVRELANTHFEGGGHKNASGGRSNLSLSATIEKFLGILPHYCEKLSFAPEQ